MKKKLKYLLFIMCFALLFVVKTDLINAGNGDDGGAGEGGSQLPGSGWVTSSNVGFRITIVLRSTGERCYYDPDKNEMCVGSDGKKITTGLRSQSYDYWWTGMSRGNCITTPNKYTKLEYGNSLSGYVGSVDCFDSGKYDGNNYLSLSDLGLNKPGSDEGYYGYFSKWRQHIDDMGAHEAPQNMVPVIVDYLHKIQNPKAMGSSNAVNYLPFSKMFTRAFYGYDYVEGRTDNLPQIDAETIVYNYGDNMQNDMYILFEQLLDVYTWNLNNWTGTYEIAGTLNEVGFLCARPSGYSVKAVGNTNQTLESPNGCNYSKYYGGWSGWNVSGSKEETGGWPNLKGWGNISPTGSNWKDSLSIPNSWFYGTREGVMQTIGMLNFWFNPDQCTTELQLALKHKDKTEYNKLYNRYLGEYTKDELYFLDHYTYDEALFLYQNSGTKAFTCGTKVKCGYKARAVYNVCGKNPGDRCTIAGKHYGSYEEALAAWSLDDNKGKQMITVSTGVESPNLETGYFKSQFNELYIRAQRRLPETPSFFPAIGSNDSTGCPVIPCDQGNVDRIHKVAYKNRNKDDGLQAEYDAYFKLLNKAVSINGSGDDTLLLLERWWTVVGRDGPRCEEIQNCPANEDIDNACVTGDKEIVLQDYAFGENNDGAKKCWQNGFAYTNLDSNGRQTGIVGSWAKNVGTGNNVCNLNCSEQVVLSLPGEAGTGTDDSENPPIRAGTIFKWGLKRDTKNNVLGTITFTKKCVVKQPEYVLLDNGSQYKPNCSGAEVNYEVTGVNGWISSGTIGDYNSSLLDYVDPLKEYKYSGLKYAEIDWTNPVETKDINTRCPNNQPDCHGLSINDLTTYGTFNIVYRNSLNWYGNKTTGEPEDLDDIKRKPGGEDNLPWYKWLGYGLPTAFMTPNGTYGADWKDKNGNGDGIFDGLLKLTFNHLGTKTNMGGKTGFTDADSETHFDMLLKKVFGSTELEYGCPFRIINELFGNDCKYEEDSMGNLVLTADSPAYCDPKDDDKVEEGKSDPNDPTGGSSTSLRRYIRDIDVVFRVIDLISESNVAPNGSIIGNAFPGILGNGRVRGHNWAKLSDSEIEDILREDIYQKEPMYSLELNTANIQYIRKLNRDARESKGTYVAADPYTEMRRFNGDNDLTDMSSLPGYTGYYCASYDANPTTGKDSYKYCASRFLSLLASDSFKGHGGAMLEGSCVGHNSTAKERALKYVKPDSSSNFVGCPKN